MKRIISLALVLATFSGIFYALLSTSPSAQVAQAAQAAIIDVPILKAVTKPAKQTIPVISQEDLDCLAKNIYFEARNQSLLGMKAVGHVTLNRVESDIFPNTVCGVVKQAQYKNGELVRHKCQFSWYCDGESDIITNIEAFRQALDVAYYLLSVERRYDITDGALFYHANYVKPYWRRGMIKVVQIDQHIFYKQ